MRATEGRQPGLFSYLYWRERQCEGRRDEAGAEPPAPPAPPTRARSTEADGLNAITGNTRDLPGRVCERGNMLAACDRVVRNAGAGGVDGMDVSELPAWLEANYDALVDRILRGAYRPKPVRRAEIPKGEKGEVRLLGIPAVVDRVVQQALAQRLTPAYQPQGNRRTKGSVGRAPAAVPTDVRLPSTQRLRCGW